MNILMLSMYPVDAPRHGGQIRTRNIADHYKRLGHHVEIVGIQTGYYPDSENFLPAPTKDELSAVFSSHRGMEDFSVGVLSSQNKYFEALTDKINIIPDIIQLEQPFFINFALKYRKNISNDIKIIYSSQNIEYKMKKEIISSLYGIEKGEEAASKIWDIEKKCIENADAVYCVSQSDFDFIQKYTDKPILLLPNGVEDMSTKECDLDKALHISKNKKFALFCASWHPPNAIGFFDMLGGAFGSLSPDQCLIIVGSVKYLLEASPLLKDSALLEKRSIITGVVDFPVLESLRRYAHCFVLPITQGGGTNLKTAEALWAGKHIVATTTAMRGFEEFIDSPGVYVADEPGEFKRCLRKAMAEPQLRLSEQEREKRKKVLWEQCLSPIGKFIESLIY